MLAQFQVWFCFYFWLSEWNGKFHELVKSSIKRREDKADKKNLGKKYEQLKSEYEKKTRLIHQLQEQVDNFQNVYDENQDHIDKLSHLYDIGLIDENGNPIPQRHDERHEDDM